MYHKKFILLILFLWGSSQTILGQASKEVFGKNRIQYKTFNWQYYSSDNFDIYFYNEGAYLAKFAAGYLEKEFDKLTDIIGYAPYSKTKIFLYNSITDLQQSNVGLYHNNVGGQTNFVKLHIEAAFPGTIAEFKKELLLKASRMLINDMMFGGNLGEIFQSAYLLNLPSWFMEGAALYLSKGWSVEMDDYIRDLFRHNQVKKLNKLSSDQAKIAGQSAWNFIAERYGKSIYI